MGKRLWRVLACLGLVSVASWATAKDAFSSILSDCETPAGWQGGLRLSTDAQEGRHAITKALKPGSLDFFMLDYADTGVDLSRFSALSLWWKVEGAGLKSFMIKVRNYPIADGLEAVYSVWESGSSPPPEGWHRSTIILAQPRYDNWGKQVDKEARYLGFRLETEPGADVRLSVDDLRAVPAGVEWRVASAKVRERTLEVVITVTNPTEQPFRIQGRAGEETPQTVEVPAQDEANIEFRALADLSRLDALKPFEAITVPVWVEIEGNPDTRTEKEAQCVRKVELPPHPRLLLDQEGIESLKRKIEGQTWANEAWHALLSRLDASLQEETRVPPRGGNWWHWHVCPKHGAALQRGDPVGEWQWQHLCPVDGATYRGDPTRADRDYDGCVIATLHEQLAAMIRDLGLAYQVSSDPRYADKARAILMEYAERYPTYALHDKNGKATVNAGRVMASSLGESLWLIDVCQGVDMLWDVLSHEERQTLTDNVLVPAAREVVLQHRLGVHNIQCWNNSALGLTGLLLGDGELVHEAIYDPSDGFWKQMAEGVDGDGLWWEGSWHYHFYTLSALWPLTEAARNCGLDLYMDTLRKMYTFPLDMAMPDGHLPAFNDSPEVDLLGNAAWHGLYELAYQRFAAPELAAILTDSDRQDEMALWFGAETLPEPTPAPCHSTNYTASGYAILRQGCAVDSTWFCLKYGPHGGGHGHPDKLSFVLYNHGRVIAPDPGTALYGAAVQEEWYRTALAHNTLVVDETSQAPAEGKCIAFSADASTPYIAAEAGPIYKGVRFIRTAVSLPEDVVLFLDLVQCDRPRCLDLAYHQTGQWTSPLGGAPWDAPRKAGYSRLRAATSREISGAVTLGTRAASGGEVTATLAGNGPTRLIMATGPGQRVTDAVPVLLFRRTAQATAFLWCVSLKGEAVRLEALPVVGADGRPLPQGAAAACEVVTGKGASYVVIANPDCQNVHVSLPGGEELRTADAVLVRCLQAR